MMVEIPSDIILWAGIAAMWIYPDMIPFVVLCYGPYFLYRWWVSRR